MNMSHIRSKDTKPEENNKLLTEMGWHVFTIWECQLKKNSAEENLEKLYREITDI